MEKSSVAVVGAGIAGLAILKNLREEGFNVTVYEKRDSVGGIWAYSDDVHTTSTLPSTISNVSRFRNAFTDFPIPEDLPPHLTAPQVHEYLKSYASHFDLNRDVQLNTFVKWVKRNAEDNKWQVSVDDGRAEEIKEFDRIVMCSGLQFKASTPKFEGMENFKGKVLHVQAFKRPEDFKDMRVLVVGMGNSAADTSTELIGHAKKVCLSHRGGVKILPRICLGIPLNLIINRQKAVSKFFLDKKLPSLSRWLFDFTIEQYSKKSFKLDPSWRLSPAPSLATHQPVISDNLVSSLWAGKLISVHGLSRFVDRETVELLDGTNLAVDAVIFCTGYEPDFSLISGFDPAPAVSEPHNMYHGPPLARLYQNLFPPEYADSLAYMNYAALTESATTMIDLAAMAIAQVWKGTYKLPSQQDMNATIDKHHQWVKSLAKDDSVYTGIVKPGPWLNFLNRTAGTGVDENLGYDLQGWKFWMRERKLCNLMMKGVLTPYMYRVFDGRRKKWDGAREAIIAGNENAKKYCS